MAAEGEFCLESARLREEIASLITRRLEKSSSRKLEEFGIGKILCKRKRKWRKKHKLEAIKPAYRPVDHHLRQEKESTEDVQIELKDVLFRKRQEAFNTARQLEREKGGYHLDSISYRVKVAGDLFRANLLSQQSEPAHHDSSRPSYTEELDQLLTEMQGAMTQVTSLRNIRQMKRTMTPRFPPLHNRTLTGNILDTTLGLFNTPDLHHVSAAPLDTTSIAPELHEIDELEQRLVLSSSCERDAIVKTASFNQEEELKTYGNVRLSTESVPLQLAIVGQAPQPDVATNQRQHSSVASNDLDITVDSDEDLTVTANRETTNVERNSPTKSPQQLTSFAAVDHSSPSPQKKNRRLTFVKRSPILGTSLVISTDASGGSGVAKTGQESEDRTLAEHSYAMICTSEDERDKDMVATREDVQHVATNHASMVSCSGDESETVVGLGGGAEGQEAPLIVNQIECSIVKEEHYAVPNSLCHEAIELSQPATIDASHDSTEGKGQNEPAVHVIEEVREHLDVVESDVEGQILEVAVMEPESDVPIPVEYTEVTQQEDHIAEELHAKDEETPPPPDTDFDKTCVVNEDRNETGEAMMIGCEVTTSTMELTDVTEMSGGGSVTTSERLPPEDISCETVIITTSAMNSSRPEGYTTPSEDSDGTTNSIEERKTREYGVGAAATVGKKSDMITANDDGTDSDAVFEDILKQIESAPYELRISNIVLAQLSRAASKSPPTVKRKRKRRSLAKKWTRPKARKSNTPRK